MYPPYLSHYVFHRQIRAAVSSVLRLSEASYLTSSEGCLGHGAGRDAGLEGPLGRRKIAFTAVQYVSGNELVSLDIIIQLNKTAGCGGPLPARRFPGVRGRLVAWNRT